MSFLIPVSVLSAVLAVQAGASVPGRQADNSKSTLVHETVISAPQKEQTHYRKEGKLGDEGTIENTILSYDPMRMISFRVTRFPKGFPFPNAVRTLWHVLYFEAAIVGAGVGARK